MSMNFSGRSRAITLGALVALSLAACSPIPGPRGLSSGAKATVVPQVRTISLATWSGDTRADVSQAWPKIDVTNGSRTIRGPMDWRHPATGQTIKVYERRNREKDGSEKIQLFTIRPDGAALARVFDRRPGQPDRVFVDDAFFPLGTWRDGEKRTFEMTEYTGKKGTKRRVMLEMKDVNFTYQGHANSTRFDWVQTAMNGETLFHERFTYSPDAGLTKFDDRLR